MITIDVRGPRAAHALSRQVHLARARQAQVLVSVRKRARIPCKGTKLCRQRMQGENESLQRIDAERRSHNFVADAAELIGTEPIVLWRIRIRNRPANGDGHIDRLPVICPKAHGSRSEHLAQLERPH